MTRVILPDKKTLDKQVIRFAREHPELMLQISNIGRGSSQKYTNTLHHAHTLSQFKPKDGNNFYVTMILQNSIIPNICSYDASELHHLEIMGTLYKPEIPSSVYNFLDIKNYGLITYARGNPTFYAGIRPYFDRNAWMNTETIESKSLSFGKSVLTHDVLKQPSSTNEKTQLTYTVWDLSNK